MANSKITITFDREAIDGEFIMLKRRLIVDPLSFTIDSELFQNAMRNSAGKISVVTASGSPGYVLGSNTNYVFNYYFNIDYNGYGLYLIPSPDANVNNNTLVIELTNSDWEFYDFSAPFATAVIENPPLNNFSIIGAPIFSMAEIGEQCDKVRVSIETAELAKKLWVNGVLVNSNNTNNPAIMDFPRGVPYLFKLENATGNILYYPTLYGMPYSKSYFDFLGAGNMSVNVLQTISGATVTVNVINTIGLNLLYSLGDGNWQTSNIFTGQSEGDYVAWVKDQFECYKSKDYSVTSLGTREPFLSISKANSIGFVEHVDFDGCTTFKNDENTLAYQGFSEFRYCEESLFQLCDSTTIQIKSNYRDVIATLRKEDLTEVILPISKLSNNLNRFASMDSWYYAYDNQHIGVYFQDGWTYDEFGAPLEEFTLNGNLPDFAMIGGIISLNAPFSATFEIKDIVYDPNINKNVLLLEYIYLGLPTQIVVNSIYDLLPFEVYSITIDWSDYGIGIYDVVLENTDNANGTVFHVSENINVALLHENTVAIRYYNENNRDIFYMYGQQNFIRVPILSITAIPKDETELNITDDDSYVVKSVVHEANEFEFDDVPTETMRRLAIALSCENLFVQDIGYVKEGSIVAENIKNTNLHKVTATLIKKGVNYTNNRNGVDELDDNLGFNIPEFLTDGQGFIKI